MNAYLKITGTVLESCESQAQEIDIPDGIETIKSGAFADCTTLVSVNIPDSVIEIGEWAFVGCTALKFVTLPS